MQSCSQEREKLETRKIADTTKSIKDSSTNKIASYNYLDKNGLKQGEWRYYHDNGKIKAIVH
jgi:antitoxin component YwqK of YwqJK toxin-antitoxin module